MSWISKLACYKKIPNRSRIKYNHCPLCKTYSQFWRKFGIQDIIKKQQSCNHRNKSGPIDYINICLNKKGFETNYEMYQHFTSKSKSCPMHFILLKYLEQLYQTQYIEFQKKMRKDKSCFTNLLFNSKQQPFNLFKLTR